MRNVVKQVTALALALIMVVCSCPIQTRAQVGSVVETDGLHACVEKAYGTNGAVEVGGWIYDEANKTSPVGIHIYIGKSEDQKTFLAGIWASKARSDIAAAVPGIGENHAFLETIKVNERGAYNLYFYALDVGGVSGKNIMFETASVNITSSTHTIYYDSNDRNGLLTMTTVAEENTSVKLSENTPTHPQGRPFLGWSVSKDDTEPQYRQGDMISVGTSDITLYAVWGPKTIVKPIQYTVAYNANGGYFQANVPEQKVDSGTTITITSSEPKRDGYRFMGWSTDGKTVRYHSGDTIKVTADLTLYAEWQADPTKTYIVSYHPNEGTFSANISNQTVEEGSTITVTNVKPSRGKDTFLGWSKNPGASTADYHAGDTIKITGDLTLYAVWRTVPTYTVSYHLNGANSGTNIPDQTAEAGGTIQVTGVAPKRDNYTFKGWSTSASGAVIYRSGDMITVTDNLTLYAVWEPNTKTYTVSYHPNGGNFSTTFSNQSVKEGDTITVTGEKPSRSGYTFKGWSTNASAGTASYQAGNTIKVTGDLTLYAVWGKEPNTDEEESEQDTDKETAYTISYNANGGSFKTAVPNQSIKKGKAVVLTSEIPVRTGYKFMGWSTGADTTQVSYKAGESILVTKNMTLYAVWEQDGEVSGKYTITYSANGGTKAPQSETAEKNKTITISNTNPTREGYTFAGWALDKGSYTADYQPGSDIVMTKNITLYAVWTQIAIDINDCTITLSKASSVYDGSSHTPAVTVSYKNTVLSKGTHYIVSYASNKSAGEAVAVIEGVGQYEGTVKKTFTIKKASQTVRASLQPSTILVGAKTKLVANGKGDLEYRSANESVAVINSDGTVTGKKKGTTQIMVTASGDGNYQSGTATVEVLVTKDAIALSKCSVALNKSSYTYTGKTISPEFTIKNGKTTLSNGSDYIVTYSKNKEVGKATATIVGKGNYNGTLKKTFTIKRAKNVITAKDMTKETAKTTKTYSLGAKAKGGVTLSYSSSDSRVKVSGNGPHCERKEIL